LAFPHLAVSNSYLIYTTTLRTSVFPAYEVNNFGYFCLRCWSWSRPCWSWSRPPWSWSRSQPVWSWSGLGLGLPGLYNISAVTWQVQQILDRRWLHRKAHFVNLHFSPNTLGIWPNMLYDWSIVLHIWPIAQA